MNLSIFEQLIITYTPLLVALAGIITTFCKIMCVIKEMKTNTQKDSEEYKAQISQLNNQNAELKRQLNELLTKIDRIGRE